MRKMSQNVHIYNITVSVLYRLSSSSTMNLIRSLRAATITRKAKVCLGIQLSVVFLRRDKFPEPVSDIKDHLRYIIHRRLWLMCPTWAFLILDQKSENKNEPERGNWDVMVGIKNRLDMTFSNGVTSQKLCR